MGDRLTTAETITSLADTALDLHTRARARIEPGGDTIGDGMPHAGGFGPKAPLSHPMLDLADSLTCTLHGLCEALWGAGTMPREHLPGLWARRDIGSFGRQVLGDLSGGQGMKHVHAYVTAHAHWIAGVPLVEDDLAAVEHVVNRGLKMFPREAPKWVTLEQACKLSGRSKWTIKDWRKHKWVDTIKDEYGVMYSRAGIIAVTNAMNEAASNNGKKVAAFNRINPA